MAYETKEPWVRYRVYVWEFPVRLTHWLNAVSIVALTITGLYIGSPYIYPRPEPQFLMGWMRFVHLSFAYLLTIMVVLRIAWGFLGNRYARWNTWVPYSRAHWADIRAAFKYHLFVGDLPPHAAGHTALGNLTYLLIFIMFFIQIFTGFALLNVSDPTWVHWVLGGWLSGIAYISTLHLYHHVFMYILLAFVIGHIYMAWYMDTVERDGVMGSIFGGYKFLRYRLGPPK
jgi:Ni/Fe-hydrogenase 1 B-type cytochrome subunit